MFVAIVLALFFALLVFIVSVAAKNQQEEVKIEKYMIDGVQYWIPPLERIESCKENIKSYFENPESLLSSWLHDACIFGPKLIEPTADYLRTLSTPDTPQNYTEDLIDELLERWDLQVFKHKNSKFKFTRTNDRVSREFTRRINATEVTIEDIDAMDGIEFEHFLCRLFTEDGFDAKVTQASNDQGGDLILEKNGGRIVVQVKNYSTHVSNDAVQQVIGAKAYYDCEYGMVITNNYFTKAAIQLAQCNEIALWSRDTLKLKLAEYNSRTKSSTPE